LLGKTRISRSQNWSNRALCDAQSIDAKQSIDALVHEERRNFEVVVRALVARSLWPAKNRAAPRARSRVVTDTFAESFRLDDVVEAREIKLESSSN